MKKLRRQLTYANVMSSIAVFLVLGGASAFATTQLGATATTGAAEAPLAGSKGAAFRRAVARWKLEEYPVSIGIQGDSITLGYSSGAGAFHLNSYGAQLRELIRSWLGGDFLEFASVADTDDPRLATTGSWTAVNQGPGRTAKRTTNGGTVTWGPVYASRFVVYYIDQPGGATMETKVDGGTFGNSIGTDAAPTAIKARTIGAGPADLHTVSVRPGSGTKPLTIVGMAAVATSRKAGLASTVFRLGYPSQAIGSITRDEGPLDALETGFTLPKAGLVAPKKGVGKGADLDLLAFTTNDYLRQTPLAAYRSELAIAGKRAKELGGSVLYLAMPEPDVGPKPIPWTEYRDAMREVAAEIDAGFLDLDEPLVGRESPLYDEAMSDTAHPTRIYHWEMASRIFEAIWFPIGPG